MWSFKMEYQRLNDAQSAAELLKETESYKGICQRIFTGNSGSFKGGKGATAPGPALLVARWGPTRKKKN